MLRLAPMADHRNHGRIVIAPIVPAVRCSRFRLSTSSCTRWAPRFSDASFGVIPLVTATLDDRDCLDHRRPAGLGAAILLSEYARPRLRGPEADPGDLAGVPTVVYGLFALAFVQTIVLRDRRTCRPDHSACWPLVW